MNTVLHNTPPAFVPLVLSKFLAEHVTSQFWLLILVVFLLDGGSLASHSSHDVWRCSSSVSSHKGSQHGCFVRPGAQGSVMAAFNPLAAQRCVLHRWGFFLSLSDSGGDVSTIYNVVLPAVVEKISRLVCSKGCTKQCHIYPLNKLIFWFIYLGMDWLGA